MILQSESFFVSLTCARNVGVFLLLNFGEKFSPATGRHCSYISFAEESAAPVRLAGEIFFARKIFTSATFFATRVNLFCLAASQSIARCRKKILCESLWQEVNP